MIVWYYLSVIALNGGLPIKILLKTKKQKMRKNIFFVVIAISAIALSSCTTTPTRVDIPNNRNQVGSDGYSQGSREQTETGTVTFTGIIDGQFIDADMVPVRLCDGQIVWAKFNDNLYKVAVKANQAVAKGNRVEVSMRETNWWQFWNWRRFEIVNILIIPQTTMVTGPGIRWNPFINPVPNTIGHNPTPAVRVPIRKTIPVVKTVQQPCCCGTSITITGTVSGGTIVINGKDTGTTKVAPAKSEPISIPAAGPADELKNFKFDTTQDSLKN